MSHVGHFNGLCCHQKAFYQLSCRIFFFFFFGQPLLLKLKDLNQQGFFFFFHLGLLFDRHKGRTLQCQAYLQESLEGRWIKSHSLRVLGDGRFPLTVIPDLHWCS